MARRWKKQGGEEEKEKSPEPTLFTAAGLLAFSEEEAVFKIKPIHVLAFTIGFMLAVIALNII